MRQLSAKLMGWVQTQGKLKNWRVGQFSIFWGWPAQIWQVKKEVGSPAHYTRISTQILTIFFLFFLYSCPPMYPYYLAWSTENQPTRFSLHIQLQLLCWKTILLLHTDPNAKKKSFTKGLRQKMAWIFQPPMKQFLFGWFYFDSPTLLFWYSKIQNNKEIHSEIVSVELIQNMAHSFKYFIGLNNLILFFCYCEFWNIKKALSIQMKNKLEISWFVEWYCRGAIAGKTGKTEFLPWFC